MYIIMQTNGVMKTDYYIAKMGLLLNGVMVQMSGGKMVNVIARGVLPSKGQMVHVNGGNGVTFTVPSAQQQYNQMA
jgi:hypothetical protein